MVKIVQDKQAKIKLQKGNKTIERTVLEYETNKAVWNFRGFKPVQDVVKEVKEEKIVELKPKRTRKKKDEQVDLAKD